LVCTRCFVHDVLTQKGEDNFNEKVQNGGKGYLNRNVNKRSEPSAHFTIETYGVIIATANRVQ